MPQRRPRASGPPTTPPRCCPVTRRNRRCRRHRRWRFPSILPSPRPPNPRGLIPQPVGSGSFLQVPVVTPHQAATADHGGGGVPIVGSTDGVAATLTDVAVAIPDSLSHIGVATLGTDALDAVGTIDTVVAHLGSSDLLPAGADIAGLAGAALDATPLSALGGSDPAAGLQTLIGMVDSADAFDLGHATNAVDSTPASILDALTADEAPSVLLGGEGDAEHHVLDDHGIHLGV